ncbi:hypothetical protein SAMN02745116_01022 [Pilibacter termitis]|uniref:KxYKxGKxW signal peptide containing protein n=1 Tax=Pilibacter termitis TaxID=263852 RepID=A0A1T4MBB3_9ENTE|nr:hypothetical protein [Pilibacter termitis]SJZ64058.1 hypothetical protein SAMN02745116_01022 [Pilibacter termitis]
MNRTKIKRTEPEYKKRFVLKKVKKRWVVTGLIFGTVVPSMTFIVKMANAEDNDVENVTNGTSLFTDPLKNYAKPKTNALGMMPLLTSLTSIENVTDADDSNGTNVGHVKSYKNVDFQSQFTLSGDNVGTDHNANAQYFQQLYNSTNTAAILTPSYMVTNTPTNRANHSGAVAFNKQVDMTKDWSMNFDFDLTGLNHGTTGVGNGTYIQGDFIGLVLSPASPSQLGSLGSASVKNYGGGSLGLLGNANTLSFGLDFYNNNGDSKMPSGYNGDPSIAKPSGGLLSKADGNQYLGFRQTDANGNLLAFNNFPSGTTVTAGELITSINGNVGATDNHNNWLQNDYNQPQLVANAVATWTASTNTLSIQMNGKTYSYQNLNLGTTSLSVGVMASDGDAYTQKGATLNTFNLTLGTGKTEVEYLNQNDIELRKSTDFIANTGDKIGIAGFDENGVTTATRDVDYQAPAFQGYHLAKATPVEVTSDTINANGTVLVGNTMTLTYQGDQQKATLTTPTTTTNGAPTPVTIPSGDQNLLGFTGDEIEFATTDSDLAQAGYTYTVTAPDGQVYSTLSQALSANPYDDTTTFSTYDTNGVATYNTDSTPQNFVVNYTAKNVTVSYGIINPDGSVDTSKTSELATNDTLTPAQLTIGQSLTSALAGNIGTNPDSVTSTFQSQNILPNGYHLTGNVYWTKDGGTTKTSLPTNALTVNDVDTNYQGEILFEVAKDFQEANVTLNYKNNAVPSKTLTQTGVTGDNFLFDLSNVIASGYHMIGATDANNNAMTVPFGSISGVFDSTNNLRTQTDSSPQNYVIQVDPDIQQLNVRYNFPAGHDLSSSLINEQKMQVGTTGNTFSDINIPVIAGYTATITYPDGSKQTDNVIKGITADNTSNGTSQIDNAPQNVVVNYTANARKVTVNYHYNSSTTTDTFTQSSTNVPYTTDGTYDAVAINQINGYTSYVSVNGSTPQAMTSVSSGSFDSSDVVIDVTYTPWQATVNYYTQQVDSSGNAIGAMTKFISQTEYEQYNFYTFAGLTSADQTTKLQGIAILPNGYHVVSAYWSNKPDGTTQDMTPPYQKNWTWDDMTNTATGEYSASIVYQYTKDIQQANITVTGAPSGKGVTNGQNTLDGMNGSSYTGVTGGTQVVSVPQINGYIAKVTDTNNNEVSLNNNQFTITYDNTNNGVNTTDATPQNYTITYTARSASVLVNYNYATNATTNVLASSSVDTTAFTAPSLPNSLEIQTQTNGTYSLNVPNVNGYTWTITDSNGNSYTSSNLPSSFTSDGTNITYTITYTPENATHVIHYYEATYDNSGNYTFTTNTVANMPAQTFSGAVGEIQSFAVTTSNISVPNGWTLDPMKASLSALTGDNDNLNGGDSAKRLTFTPGVVEYAIYLARDIQSVQVQFVNDPNSSSTFFQDGRTGENYTVDTSKYARSGYDYTITDPNGNVVTSITGVYDDTNNNNATSPILNNGAGDISPQVYKVTYTPQTQQAILKTDSTDPANSGGKLYQTASGATGSDISFANSDADFIRQGYNYNVTVSYQNSNGDVISSNYPTLAQALAANAKYNNDNVPAGQTDSNPQVFTVSYTASSQTAILKTDSSDPTGAKTVDTKTGLTGQGISFLKTDSDLVRAGYSYTVKSPNGTSYPTLSAALLADGVYDNTDNGNNTTDSSPQLFTVSYTANPLTVNIEYVYGQPKNTTVPIGDFGSQSVPTKATGVTNGTTYTTDINNTATNISTPITVPTISGYTPNVTSVTPKFTVDDQGNPTEPTITVTYTASPDTATIDYVDDNGNSLVAYIGNNPTSTNGYTDGVILSNAPSISGYTLTGYEYNGVKFTGTTDLDKAVYTAGADTIQFIYKATQQVVNINYLYSDSDNSPKNGVIPSGDFGSQSVVTQAQGDTNTTGTVVTVPTIEGYTASETTVTPDYHIDSNGDLITPEINVVYTANSQNAKISYKVPTFDSNGVPDMNNLVDATSAQTGGAPTTAVGVTDQTIGVVAPTIAGYDIYAQTVNGTPQDISTATFTAPDNADDVLEVIYVPKQQVVNVHYVYQLPANYTGTYNGVALTASDNGRQVDGLGVQQVVSYSDSIPTPAPLPSAVENGWQVSPATQKIDWTVDQNGNLKKTDYVYYISPQTNTVNIQYLAQDGFDLMKLITTNPILTQQVETGSTFTNSGAIHIPGYSYVNYTYNGATNTATPPNPMPYVAGADVLNINYTPNAQTVEVDYIYDPNSASSKAGQVAASSETQTKVSNATGDVINVPTINGYTPNVTSVTPSFAIKSDGTLVTPKITVTYTANQNNVATISYVDDKGNPLQKMATVPVSLTASGTTDQAIQTSGEVTIPGYTFDHIEFYNASSKTTENPATTADLIFSGAGASMADNVKYVYKADPQTVKVHYLYSGGGKDGQDAYPELDLPGISNQAATNTPALAEPVGYQLVKTGLDATNSQPVVWTVINGQLVTPDIYFYYQANVTKATVDYGTTATGTDLDAYVPTGTITGEVKGQTDAPIQASGAVGINGYTFKEMLVNGTSVATTTAAANSVVAPFTPNGTVSSETNIHYVYDANPQKVVVKFVDENGNAIVDNTGVAISDVTLTGATNQTIDYSSITKNYTGYTIDTDGMTTTTNYDANDNIDQVVYMIYKPVAQKVNVEFVDKNGIVIPNTTTQTLTGVSNGLIDYSSISTTVAGYTLVTDGRNQTPNYDTDPSVDQTVQLVYQANQQQVVVNFKVSRDGGATWSNLANPATLSGDSNSVIDYSKLQSAYSGYKLINNSQQTSTTNFDTKDGVNQTVTLYYAPLEQVAILQTDETDPSGKQVIASTTGGYSFGQLSFATGTDTLLARKGFTYKVYGPDGTWYDSFQAAIAANANYDGTPSNLNAITTTIPPVKRFARSVTPNNPTIDPSNPTAYQGDDSPQVFTASYTPMAESMIVETTNDPAGNKVYQAVSGVTGVDENGNPIPSSSPAYQSDMTLSQVPNVSGFYNLNVVDTQAQTTSSGLPNLARAGYTYVVEAPDGNEYSTLQAAANAVHVFDNDPSTAQGFKVKYIAQLQTAILETDTTDPKGAKILETTQGASDSNISFGADDTNLKRTGYAYKVTTPDGKEYTSLKEAVDNYSLYDHTAIATSGANAGIDTNPQKFVVSYTALEQTVNLITKDDPTGDKTIESVTGDSDTKITLTKTDNDLKRTGYTYQVQAPDGKDYATLSAALKANPDYDHNDLTNGVDSSPQNFIVTYTAVKQTANLLVDGQTKETTTGDSNSAIRFKTTDKDLEKTGYTYKVKAPDNQVYATLSEALQANPKYDNNDLTNGQDNAPQNFEVTYTAVKQTANLIVNGQIKETVEGESDTAIHFATTDKELAIAGYIYHVTAPDGKTYPSLSTALQANPNYDHNDLVNGQDTIPQDFTVTYTASEQIANLIVDGQTKEIVTGSTGANIQFATTDNDLHKSGYTYTVTAPDGKDYSTLSEALQANPNYDDSVLNNGVDDMPQDFIVRYTAVKQTVYVVTKNAPNGDKTLETLEGDSDSIFSLSTTDEQLKQTGYTYKVVAPNGKEYSTLSAAEKENNVFDHNDLTNGVDSSPQQFTIVYTKTSTTDPGDSNTGNSGNAGNTGDDTGNSGNTGNSGDNSNGDNGTGNSDDTGNTTSSTNGNNGNTNADGSQSYSNNSSNNSTNASSNSTDQNDSSVASKKKLANLGEKIENLGVIGAILSTISIAGILGLKKRKDKPEE